MLVTDINIIRDGQPVSGRKPRRLEWLSRKQSLVREPEKVRKNRAGLIAKMIMASIF